MGTIRTIKPEFFKHEDLHELGESAGAGALVRIVYAGLWCEADREGRLRWKPRRLRLEICPWDPEESFEAALEALRREGYVHRYEVDGELYGWLPKFRVHQVINVKIAPSRLPPHPEDPLPEGSQGMSRERILDAHDGRPTGTHGNSQEHTGIPVGKGTGTERNGRELEQEGGPPPAAADLAAKKDRRWGSSQEWDQSCELMTRMGCDAGTIERVRGAATDDATLYRQIRDVYDNRRARNKAGYLVGALKRQGLL